MALTGLRQTVILLTIFVSMVFGLTGCWSNPNMSEQVSAFNLDCKAKDVEIQDEVYELNGDHTWTAKCNGLTYYCADHSSAGSECVEAK